MNQVGGGAGDEQKEEQRLEAVSIAQHFSWTGLPSSGVGGSGSPGYTKGTQFVLEGLPLWNVLGYALDETDYFKLCLVCKEWKRMVGILEPPVVLKISRLLDHRPNDSQLIGEEQIDLLKSAFRSLKGRNSPLYRKLSQEGEDPPHAQQQQPKTWPHLQPQFNILLMRFVHALSTQSRKNLSTPLYGMTVEFLDSLAEEVAQNMTKTVIHNMPPSFGREKITARAAGLLFHTLQNLMDDWLLWEGVSSSVYGITHYLNRYYVHHHRTTEGRKPIPEEGAARMARHLVGVDSSEQDYGTRLLLGAALKQLARQLRLVVVSGRPEVAQNCRLLAEAHRACTQMAGAMANLPANKRMDESIVEEYISLSNVLGPVLKQAAQQEQDEQSRLEKSSSQQVAAVTIQTVDKHTFSFSPSSKFLTASGFLSRLHLQPGDNIRLAVPSAELQIAADFYAQPTPMAEIPMPLTGNCVRDVVGETYAALVEHLSGPEISTAAAVANLLDFGALSDLLCLHMTFFIQNRGPDEIRRILNVFNESSL